MSNCLKRINRLRSLTNPEKISPISTKMAQRGVALILAGVLATCAFASSDIVQKGAPKGAPKTTIPKGPVGMHAYNLHPLSEDKVFTNPANQWYYYFEVRSGLDLYPKQSYFLLDYSTSQTLLAGQGSITVFLNGYPISSRQLPATSSDSMPWKVWVQ